MLKERVKEWEEQAHKKEFAEGVAEGVEKGFEKGIEKGVEKGEAKVLLRLLENRFGPVSNEFRLRIDEADSEQLLTWAERVLTVQRLEDVFESF